MEIHFLLPSKLPVLSKTLLSLFTPPALSLRQCFACFLSTRSFKRCKDNDERAEWFFKLPAFLQTREALLFFLHELYFRPDAPYAFTLAFQAPFDPWLVVFSDHILPAPSVLHFVYHHLPTSAYRACQAVWALLMAGEWEYAKVFLECGADPKAMSLRALNEHRWVDTTRVDGVPSQLQRRVESWPVSEIASRTRCSCGHECRAQPAGPAQAEILSLLTTNRRRLAKGATDRFAPAPNSRVNELAKLAPRSWRINLHDFMLPQNGTVGRIPTPYAETGRTLISYSSSRHRNNLAAQFVDEYLDTLFRTFGEMYTPPTQAPILASAVLPSTGSP